MKNSKSIKILISILIIIFGILLSTKVSAYEYEVFQEDVPTHLEGGRYKPHYEGDFLMYCIEAGGAYKHVTLTRGEYLKWSGQGYREPANGEYNDGNSKDTAGIPDPYGGNDPWGGEKRTTMHYTQGAKIDENTHQDVAYALATAKEKGQLESMDMAHAIWATDINIGSRENPGNAMYQEAQAYALFYNKLRRRSFEQRIKDETNYTDTNPMVHVNQEDQTYTVGKFKVSYLTGDYTFTATEEGSNSAVESEEALFELFKKSITNAEAVQLSRYYNNEQKDEFNVALNNARLLLQQYNADNSSINWQEIQATKNNLIATQKELVLKPGETDDRKYEEGSDTTQTTVTKSGKFSYIKKVELIALDANAQEVSNGISDLKVINQSGAMLWNTDKDGNAINTPKSNEEFYVNFRVNNDSVKKVKLKLTFEWLDSCWAEIYEFNGVEREWRWEKVSTSTVCHTDEQYDYRTCQQMGHKYNSTHGLHKVYIGSTNHYTYYYSLVYEAKDTRQKLMGLAGLNTGKNWKTCEFEMPKENPIDITMELGGYVFLDKDEGKVNEGDSKLDPDMKEAIPGAEVWLYDVQGNLVDIKDTNEHGQYVFTQLNAQKKYYVRFVYNGMLYTNVAYNIGNPAYNTDAWKVTSKATENNAERTAFNNKFAEIGSYPTNYKITNKIFGNDLGDYNKTYLQETIADLFKEVTNEIVTQRGNEAQAYQNLANKYSSDPEIKNKLQFVADCRISAYTNGDGTTYKQFPIYSKFTISTKGNTIGGVEYKPIYDGQYWINLGIKGRPTFDLYLGKDVYKATVSVNGETETYNYNKILNNLGYYSNGFPVGISENWYLEFMRSKYTAVDNAKGLFNNDNAYNQYSRQATRGYTEQTEYNLEMRPEETAQGNSELYSDKTDKSENYAINNKYDTQLDVRITYKITVTNESSVLGAPTEIVDYYDKNYTLVDAYIGNDKGEKVEGRQVTIAQQSRYANAMYKNDARYNTVYLQPDEKALADNETLYVYVVLQLNNASQTLIDNGLLTSGKLESINVAEINGYKTYNTNNSWGLIDKDSTPGNLDIRNVEFNKASVDAVGLEDDSKRAPAFVYTKRESKTVEGTVFEDSTGKDNKVYTNQTREGNGVLDQNETPVQGVIVQLVEYKDNTEIIRATTKTDENGWYGFVGFLPGNYKIRYTYGSDDDTAMNKTSKVATGLNEKSYNGQDFQSTKFNVKDTDAYKNTNYWYTVQDNKSDAQDTSASVDRVISYSKEQDGVEIVNHKAEVFNSYQNKDYYTNYYPEMSDEYRRSLATELEQKVYRVAETDMIKIEVEYANPSVDGTLDRNNYVHTITGVDFGVVERPKSELVIDQDVKHIKVTATDGTVLFDTETGVNNLQWVAKGDINKYDKGELINIIMDDELISGSTLEITYNITVTNNGENDNGATTRAKNIINYVANNLNFEAADNNGLWEIVKLSDIQKDGNSTWINSRGTDKVKYIDLSTQTTTLKATDKNPLTKALAPGKSATAELKLKKVLSAESSSDDLQYTNMTEIVEIDNTVGRYDHGAIPGNQDLEKNPTEHDTSGASSVAAIGDTTDNPQDGTVIITPPTGSKMIYYAIGITATVILAAGIYLIKKFVIDRNK